MSISPLHHSSRPMEIHSKTDQAKLGFALLGAHPSGLGMTRALLAAGGFELKSYGGPQGGADGLAGEGISFRRARDLEDVLADPEVTLVIVAGRDEERAQQLRRALQSERHVLCAYPPDHTPEIAYEAAMIQADTRKVLLPLLPGPLHPAILKMAGELDGQKARFGSLTLIDFQQSSTRTIVIDSADRRGKPAIPGWEILRALGGDISEVSAFTSGEEIKTDEPLMLTGRFERGGLYQVQLLPHQSANRVEIDFHASRGHALLSFPTGWQGTASLKSRLETQEEESWPSWQPWPALVGVLEDALAGRADMNKTPMKCISWQSAIRGLELDDAARRSVQSRRVSLLEYPEATEEVGFKGTMTLAGCALLWGALVLFMLSRWIPWLGWIVLPVLVFFLGLQLLRWVIPRKS